jgi:hypothetical protein
VITIFFIVGLLTSLACGLLVLTQPAPWMRDLVWIFGGLIGAAMMAFAIWMGAAS